jgi:2-dehydro-3-deoxyphosphogluconate aldolase/(4S)-4-hydroxy-2-oxoglutarate aldolase
MARTNRINVINSAIELGMIPVFYNGDFDTALNITKACVAGGARLIEFTNRGPAALDVFKDLEKYCAEFLPEAILGIGSIVDAPTAALFIAAGANFVVGPCMDEETAVLCNKRKIAYMPGCGTVTEIHKAHELGCEICKLFPGGEVGGPNFVKGVLGPIPHATLMPTGGVEPTRESLEAWFGAGIAACGMGSKLVSKDVVAQGKYDELEANVRSSLSIISELKNK